MCQSYFQRLCITFLYVHQISCMLLEASSVAYKVTRPFASANSCVDPILYFLAGQDVRSNLTKKNKSSSSKSTSVSQRLTTRLWSDTWNYCGENAKDCGDKYSTYSTASRPTSSCMSPLVDVTPHTLTLTDTVFRSPLLNIWTMQLWWLKVINKHPNHVVHSWLKALEAFKWFLQIIFIFYFFEKL